MIQYNKIQQYGVKIMFFIDKRLAIKHAQKLLKTELTLGVPYKVGGKTGKFKKFHSKYYLTYSSQICYLVHDQYSLTFLFEYGKDKTMRLSLTAHNLDLSYSQNGMKMIREQYGAYTFRFDKNCTQIFFPKRSVKNMKELQEKLSADIRYWNNSGLYNLLLQLYKV